MSNLFGFCRLNCFLRCVILSRWWRRDHFHPQTHLQCWVSGAAARVATVFRSCWRELPLRWLVFRRYGCSTLALVEEAALEASGAVAGCRRHIGLLGGGAACVAAGGLVLGATAVSGLVCAVSVPSFVTERLLGLCINNRKAIRKSLNRIKPFLIKTKM